MYDQVKEFPFEKDPNSSVPLWVQLRKRIVFLISSGYFKPGEKLPKIRELAMEVGINFNTVNKAYLSLISDGYLESIRGKGVFVRKEIYEDWGISVEVEAVLMDCLNSCHNLGLSNDDVLSQMSLLVNRLKLKESRAQQPAGSNVVMVNTRNQKRNEKDA